jgi:hypothetical protein
MDRGVRTRRLLRRKSARRTLTERERLRPLVGRLPSKVVPVVLVQFLVFLKLLGMLSKDRRLLKEVSLLLHAVLGCEQFDLLAEALSRETVQRVLESSVGVLGEVLLSNGGEATVQLESQNDRSTEREIERETHSSFIGDF